MGRRRVLITGGAGLVGSILRSHWGDRYDLILADVASVGDPAQHEAIKAEISKPDFQADLAQELDRPSEHAHKYS